MLISEIIIRHGQIENATRSNADSVAAVFQPTIDRTFEILVEHGYLPANWGELALKKVGK